MVVIGLKEGLGVGAVWCQCWGDAGKALKGAAERQHGTRSVAGAHRLPNPLSSGGLIIGLPCPTNRARSSGHTQP